VAFPTVYEHPLKLREGVPEMLNTLTICSSYFEITSQNLA